MMMGLSSSIWCAHLMDICSNDQCSSRIDSAQYLWTGDTLAKDFIICTTRQRTYATWIERGPRNSIWILWGNRHHQHPHCGPCRHLLLCGKHPEWKKQFVSHIVERKDWVGARRRSLVQLWLIYLVANIVISFTFFEEIGDRGPVWIRNFKCTIYSILI